MQAMLDAPRLVSWISSEEVMIRYLKDLWIAWHLKRLRARLIRELRHH
jgi:hypothetical protein